MAYSILMLTAPFHSRRPRVGHSRTEVVSAATADPDVTFRRGETVSDFMLQRPKALDDYATLADVRAMFESDHVHAIPVVSTSGRLVTVIERSDLESTTDSTLPVTAIAMMHDRCVAPGTDVLDAWEAMRRVERRRLVVVDHTGRLLGLLCLKSTAHGFCSETDVTARGADLARHSTGCHQIVRSPSQSTQE